MLFNGLSVEMNNAKGTFFSTINSQYRFCKKSTETIGSSFLGAINDSSLHQRNTTLFGTGVRKRKGLYRLNFLGI